MQIPTPDDTHRTYLELLETQLEEGPFITPDAEEFEGSVDQAVMELETPDVRRFFIMLRDRVNPVHVFKL
jgi:hypothetical protein